MLYFTTWIELWRDRRALTFIERSLIGGVVVASMIVCFELYTTATSSKFGAGMGHHF